MLLAAKKLSERKKPLSGQLAFLITSGEEGDDFLHGTPYVMEELSKQDIKPNYCIVGEPSSTAQLGDVVKIGRRGSLTGRLPFKGKQGHVAYPHLAQNPIHEISSALHELTSKTWDKGNEYFPPTSFQITHIESGGHAGNIIPGSLYLQFNLRYSNEQTDQKLMQAIESCFSRHNLKPDIKWQLNGEPFLTESGQLIESTTQVIEEQLGRRAELSTSGGTSDGRFIAPYGVEVVELGPINKTIHQVNECVSLSDLEALANIYYLICERLIA